MYGGCEDASGPGRAKTSSLGRKTDRLVAAPEKKVKKPAGLQTRPAWWRQDCLGACPAVGRGVTDCQVWRMLPCRPEVADRDDLVSRPNPDDEGAGSPPQDGVGDVVGAVEWKDDAAATKPDKGGAQQFVWQLGRQLGTGIVPGQEKSRSIQSFFYTFVDNFINRKLISLQKFVGQDNWSTKNYLSRGSRSTKGNSLDQVAAVAPVRCSLSNALDTG
jgi:hypothetical protein